MAESKPTSKFTTHPLGLGIEITSKTDQQLLNLLRYLSESISTVPDTQLPLYEEAMATIELELVRRDIEPETALLKGKITRAPINIETIQEDLTKPSGTRAKQNIFEQIEGDIRVEKEKEIQQREKQQRKEIRQQEQTEEQVDQSQVDEISEILESSLTGQPSPSDLTQIPGFSDRVKAESESTANQAVEQAVSVLIETLGGVQKAKEFVTAELFGSAQIQDGKLITDPTDLLSQLPLESLGPEAQSLIASNFQQYLGQGGISDIDVFLEAFTPTAQLFKGLRKPTQDEVKKVREKIEGLFDEKIFDEQVQDPQLSQAMRTGNLVINSIQNLLGVSDDSDKATSFITKLFPQGLTTQQLEETVTTAEMLKDLLSKSPEEFRQFQYDLFVGGYYGSLRPEEIGWGFKADDKTIAASIALVQDTAQLFSLGEKLTVDEVLDISAQNAGRANFSGVALGSGGGTSQIELDNPADISKVLDEMSQRTRGQEATLEEQQAFISMWHEAQRNQALAGSGLGPGRDLTIQRAKAFSTGEITPDLAPVSVTSPPSIDTAAEQFLRQSDPLSVQSHDIAEAGDMLFQILGGSFNIQGT